MTKNDLASYLVSLHTLLDAQTKGQRSIPTIALVDEYEKHWELLKQTIQKENDDAKTRTAEPQRAGKPEDSADLKSGESRRGGSDWTRRAEDGDVSR